MMDYDVPWQDLGRVTSMGLAVVALVLLGRKRVLYWARYQEKTKDFWWVMTVWCLVILFGTAEILFGWDSAGRIMMITFALFLSLKVLLTTNEVDKPTFTKEW